MARIPLLVLIEIQQVVATTSTHTSTSYRNINSSAFQRIINTISTIVDALIVEILVVVLVIVAVELKFIVAV